MVSGTSFLVTLLVGRICGSQVRLYSLGFSLVVLALGVQTALVSTPFTVYRVRYGSGSAAAAHGGSSLVASGLVIAVVTCVFVAATGLLMWTARFDDFVPTAWAICIAMPWLLGREFARRFDLARLKMGYACLLDASVMLLTVAGLQLAIQAKFLSPVTTFVIMAIAAAATSLAWLGVRFRRSELRIVPATILPELQRDLQFGRWVVADQMLAVAHLYILHWLLAWVVSTSATGILAACFSIAALASPFLQGMGNFLSPQFVESVTNRGRAATYHLLWKAIAGMVLVMIVYAVAVSLAGNWLLGVLVCRCQLRRLWPCRRPARIPRRDHRREYWRSSRGRRPGESAVQCLGQPDRSVRDVSHGPADDGSIRPGRCRRGRFLGPSPRPWWC